MKISQIVLLGIALFLAVQSANCTHNSNCGLGSGSDACGCSEVVVKASRPIRPVKFADPHIIKETIAVRKVPSSTGCGTLHPPRHIQGPSVTDLLRHSGGPIAPRFQPIGDLCTSCKTNIAEVVPAYPGKPVCRSCLEKVKQCESGYADPHHFSNSNSNQASYTSFSSNPELNAFDDGCLSFDEQENIYNGQTLPASPVDPVSLSLVYGLTRQTTRPVSEGSLAYGAKGVPIDGSVRKTIADIAEEKLLTIEKPIVELKFRPNYEPSSTREQVLAQQEELEQQLLELDAQAEESGNSGLSSISYSDLGYGPSMTSENHFISTVTESDSVAADAADDDSACGPVGPTVPGYIRGNLIVRSEPEPAQESDPEYSSEGSCEQDSDQDEYESYSSEESAPRDGCSGFLARLRASAHAQSGYGCGCGH